MTGNTLYSQGTPAGPFSGDSIAYGDLRAALRVLDFKPLSRSSLQINLLPSLSRSQLISSKFTPQLKIRMQSILPRHPRVPLPSRSSPLFYGRPQSVSRWLICQKTRGSISDWLSTVTCCDFLWRPIGHSSLDSRTSTTPAALIANNLAS